VILKRSELWWVDLPEVGVAVGHEQAGRRPCLILSGDRLNASSAKLLIVAPLTRTDRGRPSHVRAGTPKPSFIMCEQMRSISKRRVVSPMGTVSADTMAKVEDVLRLLLGL
jgi:mRNA interferase MazF